MNHKILTYDANLAPFEKDIDLRMERYEKKKKDGGFLPPPKLLLAEGLAVGTLIHSGITFVGTN